MKKRILSMLLVLVMVLGMFPMSAMAAESEQSASAPQFIVRAMVDGEVSAEPGLKTSFWMNTSPSGRNEMANGELIYQLATGSNNIDLYLDQATLLDYDTENYEFKGYRLTHGESTLESLNGSGSNISPSSLGDGAALDMWNSYVNSNGVKLKGTVTKDVVLEYVFEKKAPPAPQFIVRAMVDGEVSAEPGLKTSFWMNTSPSGRNEMANGELIYQLATGSNNIDLYLDQATLLDYDTENYEFKGYRLTHGESTLESLNGSGSNISPSSLGDGAALDMWNSYVNSNGVKLKGTVTKDVVLEYVFEKKAPPAPQFIVRAMVDGEVSAEPGLKTSFWMNTTPSGRNEMANGELIYQLATGDNNIDLYLDQATLLDYDTENYEFKGYRLTHGESTLESLNGNGSNISPSSLGDGAVLDMWSSYVNGNGVKLKGTVTKDVVLEYVFEKKAPQQNESLTLTIQPELPDGVDAADFGLTYEVWDWDQANKLADADDEGMVNIPFTANAFGFRVSEFTNAEAYSGYVVAGYTIQIGEKTLGPGMYGADDLNEAFEGISIESARFRATYFRAYGTVNESVTIKIHFALPSTFTAAISATENDGVTPKADVSDLELDFNSNTNMSYTGYIGQGNYSATMKLGEDSSFYLNSMRYNTNAYEFVGYKITAGDKSFGPSASAAYEEISAALNAEGTFEQDSDTSIRNGELRFNATSSVDVHIELCFKAREAATFTPVVTAENGTVSENMTYVENTENGTTWIVSVTPNVNYKFTGVQSGDNELVPSTDGTTVTIEVTEAGQAWTACFEKYYPVLSTAEGTLNTDGGNLWYKGDTVQAYVTFQNPEGVMVKNTVQYTLKDSSGNVLAQGEKELNLSGSTSVSYSKVYFYFEVSGAVAADGTVLFEYVIGEEEATGNGEYSLDVCTEEKGELHATYLDTCTTNALDYTALDKKGSEAYDAVSYLNEETGELTTYLATIGGVHKYTTDGTMSFAEGIRTPGFNGNSWPCNVYGIGGPDEEHLTAYVYWSARSGDFGALYNYDTTENKWVQNSASQMSYPGTSGAKMVLVLDADDVYVTTSSMYNSDQYGAHYVYGNAKHWNGTAWESFTLDGATPGRFEKAGNGVVYTAAANKLYQYNGENWVELAYSGINIGSATGDRLDVLSYADGTLYVKNIVDSRLEGYYAIDVSTGGATGMMTEAQMEGTTPTNKVLSFVGAAFDGSIYASTTGHTYYGSSDPNSGSSGNFGSSYTSGQLFELTGDKFVKQNVDAMTGLNADNGNCTRADYVTELFNTAEGATVLTGQYGANYLLTAQYTISFNSLGGSKVEDIVQYAGESISAPASPTYDGFTFAGWYISPYDTTTAFVFDTMPAKNVELYARWISDSPSIEDEFAADRANALEDLNEAVAQLSESDYETSEWAQVRSYYEAGIAAIEAAETYDGIYQALNDAITNIQSVTASRAGLATVCVSMDLFTLEQGYIIEPVLVEVDKYEQVSVIITELLKEKYPDIEQPWKMTGSVTSDFYLSYVYVGESAVDTIYPGYIGEFDNGDDSGWMYAVNNDFPGVGASSSNVVNGDVIRWQYTATGLGADLRESAALANKDALTWRIAEINAAGEQAAYGTAYQNAMTVLSTRSSSQSEVDSALAALNGIPDEPEQPATYTVTVTSDGNGTATANTNNAVEGAEITLVTTPAEGYRFKEWQVVSGSVTVSENKFTMPADNVEIKAIFEKIPEPDVPDTPDTPEQTWENIMDKTRAYLIAQATENAPVVGSISGEWLVLDLARDGVNTESEFFTKYYDNVVAYVAENINATTGTLHKVKSTENSRVILALTALGKDVTDVGGHNLLQGLSNTDFVKKQGINGPVWALIALDSHDYEIPTDADSTKQVTREWLVNYILDNQLAEGGWGLGESPDDMTPMTVQALAPYYNSNPQVKAAVDKALTIMESMIESDSPETQAQIIVARATMGLDSVDALANMLNFALENGSFKKSSSATDANQMSTEQAFYALVAYDRFKNDKNALYDMSDVVIEEPSDQEKPVEQVTLSSSALSMKVGETDTIVVLVSPADATDRTVIWSSSNTNVATVSANGVVTAVAEGSAIITATAGGKSASCIVTVTKASSSEPKLEFGLTEDEIVGYVTISFEDNGIRKSAELSEIESEYRSPLGTIIRKTRVPFTTGDTIASVTLRLLDEKGFTASYDGNEYGSFYLEAIGNFTAKGHYYRSFGEFDAGRDSGWMITWNDWFIDQGASEFEVENGDVIRWQYTCQLGADIGDVDWSDGPSGGNNTTSEDRAAAREVKGLIEVIGTVTKDSGAAIKAARTAYNALTNAQKNLVPNYDDLVVAEKKYAELTKDKIEMVFSDVSEDAYYYEAVEWAVEMGITKGTSDTTFSPEASCTRAQMVTFLWRAAGEPKAKSTTCAFTDVDKDAYYYEALLWAVENGITNGTSDTTFSPDADCNRGQMAAFLYRSANTPVVSGNHAFVDVKADAYYNDAVIWAAARGITKGTSDTTFSPDADCTRGQMVTFLYRFMAE